MDYKKFTNKDYRLVVVDSCYDKKFLISYGGLAKNGNYYIAGRKITLKDSVIIGIPYHYERNNLNEVPVITVTLVEKNSKIKYYGIRTLEAINHDIFVAKIKIYICLLFAALLIWRFWDEFWGNY